MDFEIEFHPVGEGEKAGDAITIRYRDPESGAFRIIVVDGGTQQSGELVAAHIKSNYGENAFVSDVVSTHPDTDHASGLRVILSELDVGRLWVHGLWHHAAEMLPLFLDKRWTVDGLASEIRSKYPIVNELIEMARDKGIEIHEPFEGAKIGPFTVLSPTKYAYVHLVPQFRKTPDADADELKRRNMWLSPKKSKGLLAELLAAAIHKAQEWIEENWANERLQEGGITAAENESSTVLYAPFENAGVLLTADAGINALWWGCEAAETRGMSLAELKMIQVPHHGSRRNVSPRILNRLIGCPLAEGSSHSKLAVVSAPMDGAKHPRKLVMNAFKRRGVGVHSTQGRRFRFHSGSMPERPQEVEAQVMQFFSQVEKYD